MDIRLENLSYSYSDVRALSEVDLEIKEGSITAVIGRNGSGKTTLAKIISGLIKPAHGDVYLGKKRTSELLVKDLAGKVGYLFQNPDDQIFSKTVYDEVSFGPLNIGYKREKADYLVEKSLRLTGLEKYRSENPLELCSDKRRLLALASVIALDSPAIIMDEPACGLGSFGKRILIEVIEMIKREGKTLLVITHDMDFVVENLSSCLLLKEGKSIFHGKSLDLFSDSFLCFEGGLEAPQIVKLCKSLDLKPVSGRREFIDNLYKKRMGDEEK